jgi:hypothetical protein
VAVGGAQRLSLDIERKDVTGGADEGGEEVGIIAMACGGVDGDVARA